MKNNICTPTGIDIARYADRVATRHERAGNGTLYPTVAMAAHRFNIPQSKVEELISEVSDNLPITEFDYVGLASYYCTQPQSLAEHVIEVSRTDRSSKHNV